MVLFVQGLGVTVNEGECADILEAYVMVCCLCCSCEAILLIDLSILVIVGADSWPFHFTSGTVCSQTSSDSSSDLLLSSTRRYITDKCDCIYVSVCVLHIYIRLWEISV